MTYSDTVRTVCGGVDNLGSEHVNAYGWIVNEAALIFNLDSA